MLKLHQLFFRRFALFLIGIFVAGAALGYALLRQMEIGTHERMLRQTLFLLQQDLATLPPEAFAARIRRLRRATGIRVTVIAPDGRVRFESDRDPLGMENHADRPEIRQAHKRGQGAAVRRSRTLGKDLLYVVQRTPEGYLRLAYSLERINDQLLILWGKALLFLGGVLGILLLLSVRFHRRIDRDMEILRDALDRLLKKEFGHRAGSIRCCREMEEIGARIRKVAKKLAKRERQKAKYTRRLREQTQLQSDLISAIGHEFRNPVAAIMGYAQSLEEGEGLDPARARRFLAKIRSNAEKISQMIDRLALAIRLESRGLEPRRSRFALAPVVESVRETLLQKYPGREIRLECAPGIHLEADRDLMEHLLLNLTENALKYSEEAVRLRCDGERLEVIDRGIGIAEKEREKITRRFYRVGTQGWNNSLGVGLFIVEYILRLHDTELEIRSVPGEGSVFAFSLAKMRETERPVE